jgi:hypothetical protein
MVFGQPMEVSPFASLPEDRGFVMDNLNNEEENNDKRLYMK